MDRICATGHRALRARGVLLSVHCVLRVVAGTIERLSALGVRARGVDRAQVLFGR